MRSEQLHEQLQKARRYDDAVRQQMQGGKPLQSYKAGKVIANAYEQLRNATELSEGGITIQRAIQRFYKRTLFLTHLKHESVGEELIIELTLGGYIQENGLGENAPKIITKLVNDYAEVYRGLRDSGIAQKEAMHWVLAILSVRTYDLLLPHAHDLVITSYAYQYFLDKLAKELFTENDEERSQYKDALYVAVHQALLQADIDAVRTDLLHVRRLDGSDIDAYIQWNTYADELYTSPLTLRLKRAVSRNGAPFRVLRSLIATDMPEETLLHRESFLQLYRLQIDNEDARLNSRLNNGVIKSIVFLFLTKVLVGLAVEIPFDLYMYGHVKVLPLTINLLFPPLYMASIWLTLSVPTADDAREITDFADKLLFGEKPPALRLLRSSTRNTRARLGYGFLFLVPFVVTYFILDFLNFNLLQMVIFVVFFSTASFLGFRLNLMIRELRMATGESGIFALFRDLFYLPYILVGQWLTRKYASINVFGELLDLIIELPLKTALSLMRQWIRFLREKHEELY